MKRTQRIKLSPAGTRRFLKTARAARAAMDKPKRKYILRSQAFLDGYEKAKKEYIGAHSNIADREKALEQSHDARVRSVNISLMQAMAEFANASAQAITSMSRALGESK